VVAIGRFPYVRSFIRLWTSGASICPAHSQRIYVDTSKQVGDKEHIKMFRQPGRRAETWFEENDPEGVAFEYEVLE
jgi:hypothetical protein